MRVGRGTGSAPGRPGTPLGDEGGAPLPDDQAGEPPVPNALPDALLRDVLAGAAVLLPHGVAVVDARGPDQALVWVNDAFCALTGYPPAELLGRDWRLLQCDDTSPQAVLQLRSRLRDGRSASAVLLNQRRDGSRFWNDLTVVPVRDQDGTTTHIVGLVRDVTEQVVRNSEITRLASHDQLTGLPNRVHVEQVMAAAAARMAPDQVLALVYLDLDGFKAVNDAHGHAVGDRLLQVVAGRLAGHVRKADLLCRLHGDEFVLVLCDLGPDGRETARGRAQELVGTLAAPFDLDGTVVRVSASVGVSASGPPTTAEQLLAQADAAMYAAKRASGSQVRTAW